MTIYRYKKDGLLYVLAQIVNPIDNNEWNQKHEGFPYSAQSYNHPSGKFIEIPLKDINDFEKVSYV